MGVTLIFLIQWLFLGDLRSALIVSATIPFALLFAVVDPGAERRIGEPAVDGRHRLRHHRRRHRDHGGEHLPPSRRSECGHAAARPARATPRRPRPASSPRSIHASTEVTQAIFFSATIIIAGFLPLFTLSGVEGHIFGPMARTYAYALSGGLLGHLHHLAGARRPAAAREGVGRPRRGRCARCAASTRRCRDVVLARAALDPGRRRSAPVALAILAGSTIGLEFLPKLEEGNMWIRAVMPASISLEAGNDYANRMRKLIKSFPEAETVISQHGTAGRRHRSRPASSTPSSSCRSKPFDQWRKGLDKEELIAEINDALQKAFPGVEFTFSQYIQDNVQEAASGVKGENSVKVYRPRPRDPGQGGRRDQERHRHRARHHRPRRVGLARPADHPHRHRPQQGRPLRPRPRRHQRHGPGGDRRPGGGRRLRERQRPALPDDRPPGAALSREHRGDQAHPDRRAGSKRQSPRCRSARSPRWSSCRAPTTSTASSRSATSR